MIKAIPFNMVSKQKGVEVFIISFKDILKEQAKEEVVEINLKLILLKEFYKYLNVFL
jgi:hypothetical protein